MVIRYNWYELNTISQLPESHILLIFALYIGNSKPLSANLTMLKKKLNIETVPLALQNYIVPYKTGVFSHFKTLEPQSFIRNCSFLHMKLSAQTKADYIYILSQRSLAHKKSWIPDYYIEPKYYNNPLITKIHNKITFPLEINNG